jgi:hypothetical protein
VTPAPVDSSAPSTPASPTADPKPAAQYGRQLDPRTSVADLAAIRKASGLADPLVTAVTFKLWDRDLHQDRTRARLDDPRTPAASGEYAVDSGRVERSSGAGYRQTPPFRLSSVRFDLLPELVTRAEIACSDAAPANGVVSVTVQLADSYATDATMRFDLRDPATGQRASLDFTADGQRSDPDQVCRFS